MGNWKNRLHSHNSTHTNSHITNRTVIVLQALIERFQGHYYIKITRGTIRKNFFVLVLYHLYHQ